MKLVEYICITFVVLVCGHIMHAFYVDHVDGASEIWR